MKILLILRLDKNGLNTSTTFSIDEAMNNSQLLNIETPEKNGDSHERCNLCSKQFVETEFYQRHLKSKKHRRKLKKIKENETPSLVIRRGRASAFVNKRDELFREKYKPGFKKSENEHFLAYICSLAAYYSVNLALDEDVDDFKLAYNDKKWSTLGDIVFEIDTRNSKRTYVIQCKSVFNTTKQIDSLTSGKFNLENQFNTLSKLENISDMESAHFVIFTTGKRTKKCETDVHLKKATLSKWFGNEDATSLISFSLKQLTNKKKEIMNTTDDNENICLFSCTQNENVKLPKLYLYENQLKLKHLGKAIDDNLSSKVGSCHDFYKEYIKYIETWMNGLLGGNFKLRKRDVILKIGEILLRPYTKRPEYTNTYQMKEDFSLWNEVVKSVDVTIIDESQPSVLTKICLACNKIVEETFSVKIDPFTKTISSKQIVVDNIRNKKVKAFLFETSQSKPLPDMALSIAYRICWKAGLMPLFVKAGDRKSFNFILKVIEFVKIAQSGKSYTIECSSYNIRNMLPFFKSLNVFTNLDDIRRDNEKLVNKLIFKIILEQTYIRTPGNKIFTLETIWNTDKHFLKYITPGIFMDMSLGRYSFEQIDEDIGGDSFGENCWKIVLSPEKMEEFISAMGTSEIYEKSNWLHGINPDWL